MFIKYSLFVVKDRQVSFAFKWLTLYYNWQQTYTYFSKAIVSKSFKTEAPVKCLPLTNCLHLYIYLYRRVHDILLSTFLAVSFFMLCLEFFMPSQITPMHTSFAFKNSVTEIWVLSLTFLKELQSF